MIVPKSGWPVFGQTDVNSGRRFRSDNRGRETGFQTFRAACESRTSGRSFRRAVHCGMMERGGERWPRIVLARLANACREFMLQNTSSVRAVVLLSGGLDSATTAAIARADGFRLLCAVASTTASGIGSSSRRPGAWPSRSASSGTSSMRGRLGGSSAAARSPPTSTCRSIAATTRCRTAFPSPTCRRATRCFCRWRSGMLKSLGAADIVHRRQRGRLLGLSRLPAGVHRGVRAAGEPGDEGGRRRHDAVSHPHAADYNDQSRDHSPRHGAGRRLWPDAQLLRAERRRHRLRPLRRLPACG